MMFSRINVIQIDFNFAKRNVGLLRPMTAEKNAKEEAIGKDVSHPDDQGGRECAVITVI